MHVDSKTNAGGVALYIKENIRFNVRNDLNVQVEKCENLWIEIEQKPHSKKLIVGVIYRHPTYDFKTFENKLIDLLISFEDKKCKYVIIGDININYRAGSVVEWLKHRTNDQHGLGSKPTYAILLCPWERHFTALSPAWWS